MITGGCVLGEVLTLLHTAVSAGIFLSLLAGVLWLCLKMGKSRVFLLFPVFLVLGFFRMNLENQEIGMRRAWQLDGRYGQAQGQVREVRRKETSMCYILEDVEISTKDGNGTLPRLMIYVGLDRGETLLPGDLISVTGVFRSFQGLRNPGQFDTRKYYYSQKLEFDMKTESLTVEVRGRGKYRAVLHRIRNRFLKILDQITDPEDTGVFQAALLGEKEKLDSEIKDLYQENGIAHLLAISGLHVTLIGMGAYGILRKAGLGYGAAGIACGILIISYGILTGETASVTRAALMLCCSCGANYLGRTYDLVSAACLSALILLWDSPYALFQGGVQLSYGAVLAIGMLGRYLNQVFESSPCNSETLKTKSFYTKVLRTILTSLAIQLVTYPLILYHFFQYPIYGMFLNFVVVPLMAYVIYSGLAGILLGSFSITAGFVAIGSGHYILRFYVWICGLCSRLPNYNLILGRPQWSQLICYGICSLTGLYLLKRTIRMRIKMGILLLMTACCFFLLHPLPVKGMEVVFLDVGQGDGIVIRTDNCNILIDGGSSSEKSLGTYRLEPYLKSKGISVIDYAIVSHADADHINGLQYLLEEETGITIKNLLLPCLGTEDAAYAPLVQAGTKKGSNICYMAQGDFLKVGELTFYCLYPGRKDYAGDRNDQSAMYKVSYGNVSLLLTGDMGQEGEEKMLEDQREQGTQQILENIQVLKAGHHGSKTSTGHELLDTIPFRWAVLSYGEDNSYGHPHKEVVDRLEDAGIHIWRTARSGAVTLKTDGTKVTWFPFIG